MKLYKDYSKKPFSFIVNDIEQAKPSPMQFRQANYQEFSFTSGNVRK